MCRQTNQQGFSYIDVMIALLILMIGILASAAALTANLVRSFETEKQVIAKQIALSTIESVFTARDISQTGAIDGWNTVGNAGDIRVPQGIFLTGFLPIREDLGWDGVAGTADDACAASGPCVVPDRPNNTSAVVQDFVRQVVITDIEDPERPYPANPIARRRIDVTVRYNINQLQRQQTVSTIVANFSDNLE